MRIALLIKSRHVIWSRKICNLGAYEICLLFGCGKDTERNAMRRLIIARIVHAPSDMGSASAGLVRSGISALGKQAWEENQMRIERFWKDMEEAVDGLQSETSRLHIYQDGLPCAGELGKKIVRETAAKGSRNYQIVQKLMDRGAQIEATESAPLLRQEYSYIKAFLDAGTPQARESAETEYNRIKDRLLEERDRFIAASINSTLKDGETGLLFIGASHHVQQWLPEDIEVTYID